MTVIVTRDLLTLPGAFSERIARVRAGDFELSEQRRKKRMAKWAIGCGVIVLIGAIVIGLPVIGGYNSLVALDQAVQALVGARALDP